MLNYFPASHIVFLNKSIKPINMYCKHKTIVTRTFLLNLDLDDNKDLL